MKRVLVATFSLAAVVLAIVAIQVSRIAVYHDGRCGAQKWERYLLWMDFGEPDYDEYGIEKRWRLAHRGNCEHIWLPGPMGVDDVAGYWPPLHLAIAQRVPIGRLLEIMKSYPEAAKERDKLGRTVMHWTIFHPDADRLKEILVASGTDIDAKDDDGLTPGDWLANYRGTQLPSASRTTP